MAGARSLAAIQTVLQLLVSASTAAAAGLPLPSTSLITGGIPRILHYVWTGPFEGLEKDIEKGEVRPEYRRGCVVSRLGASQEWHRPAHCQACTGTGVGTAVRAQRALRGACVISTLADSGNGAQGHVAADCSSVCSLARRPIIQDGSTSSGTRTCVSDS